MVNENYELNYPYFTIMNITIMLKMSFEYNLVHSLYEISVHHD